MCHLLFDTPDVPEETVSARKRDFEVGDMVAERYQIVSVIGEGGMGLVFKAKHILMNRFVALKIIKSDLISNQTLMQRFHQEAQAVSKLQHQNIVTVYDYGVTAHGTPYLVMDFLDGISLSELITTQGKLPVDQATDIFEQACRGLQHAHDKGIIHRDFKSSNLMICGGERPIVKVVDFGMAKLLRPDAENTEIQELTQTGEIFGSPLYMSPEQCRGQKLDERSDIYSLACVMYYALTGTPPLLGDNVLDTLQRQIHDDPAPMNAEGKGFPPALEAIIMKALRKNPDNRYQNIAELLADLQAVAAGRERIYVTTQMKKPSLQLSKPELPKKQPLFSHMFETNLIAVMLIGAVCVGTTAFMTGRLAEEDGDQKEMNRWVQQNQAGDKAKHDGKVNEAIFHYKRAVAEARKFGKSDPRMAKSLISLGATYIDQKEYSKAETQLKRAESILTTCYGPNCSELATIMLMLSRAYDDQGRKAEAADLHKKAMALLEGSIGGSLGRPVHRPPDK